MKVTGPIPTSGPENFVVKVGFIDPKVAAQLGRLVNSPHRQSAILTAQPLRLSDFDKVNLPTVGQLSMLDTGSLASAYVRNVMNTYQTDIVKADLKQTPGFGSAGTLTMMTTIDCAAKLLDKKATPPKKFAAVAGALSSTAELIAKRNPTLEWMGAAGTTFQVVDFFANGYALYSDFRSPNRDVLKCAVKAVPMLCQIGSLIVSQYPQLAPVKTGLDTMAMAFKFGDRYVLTALAKAGEEGSQPFGLTKAAWKPDPSAARE